jgi:signal transduction histidine kinase
VEHGSTSPCSPAREDAAEHGSTSPRSGTREDAVEHGDDAGSVTVRVHDTPDGIAVADDGPGIPPEEREGVFGPGYTTAHAGTGFGLAIVREIANAHGWSASVEESDDGGARFVITIDAA